MLGPLLQNQAEVLLGRGAPPADAMPQAPKGLLSHIADGAKRIFRAIVPIS